MLQAADLNHSHGEAKFKSGRARRATSKRCAEGIECFVSLQQNNNRDEIAGGPLPAAPVDLQLQRVARTSWLPKHVSGLRLGNRDWRGGVQ